MHHGALRLIDVTESSELRPTARCRRSPPGHKPLKTVASKRARKTTVSDLLANRWQTALGALRARNRPGPTPGLTCWLGWSPRRNRTGDPILTMNLALTAVRTSISAGRRRPWTAE